MLIDPQKSVPEARVEGVPGGPAYPDNPILVRHWRGEAVESVHRGIWALVDPDGHVIDGVGAFEHPIFARSSTKALQALPLLETGAADRFGFGEPELALAVASHNGERCHTDVVQRMLDSIELEVGDLRCGAHRPYDREPWAAVRAGRPRARPRCTTTARASMPASSLSARSSATPPRATWT